MEHFMIHTYFNSPFVHIAQAKNSLFTWVYA